MVGEDTFTADVPRAVIEHVNFRKWEVKTDRSQLIKVQAAKGKAENEGLVTNVKDLKDGLYEKKWKNGLRVYFAIIKNEYGKGTLLFLGSGKDKEQNKAIMKSRKALENYQVVK